MALNNRHWVQSVGMSVWWKENKRATFLFNTSGCFLGTAPGGTLSDDMTRTEYCLFTAQEDLETMQAYAQVDMMPNNWFREHVFHLTVFSTFIVLNLMENHVEKLYKMNGRLFFIMNDVLKNP